MDRASLINDAFALSKSGHLDYSVPLSMVQYLKNEQDFVPWEVALRELGSMEKRLKNTDAYPMYRQVKRTICIWHSRNSQRINLHF